MLGFQVPKVVLRGVEESERITSAFDPTQRVKLPKEIPIVM
jgi:hypothetical protein